MIKTIRDISKNIKFKRKIVYTDNLVFRLHYRYTFAALIVCVILVSSRQYFGEHIRCIADKGVNENVIDTFCFFTNTFTVVRHYNSVDGAVPHPGVGPMVDGEPIIRHAYYQWVPYVLFLQAVLCFVPHFIWQQFEGGRIKSMTMCFNNAVIATSKRPVKVNDSLTIPSQEEKENKIDEVCRAFIERLHVHTMWAFGLVFCEILNVLNIVMQVFLMEWFLGGRFMGIGEMLLGAEPGTDNPMDIVFPKVTKCTFHKYGPSGSIQKHDALCVMALNVVNEKIYTFLWFWYIILLTASAFIVFYRFLSMLLYSRSRSFNRYAFLWSCPVQLDTNTIKTVTKACHYADLLFLHHLAKSLDGFVFTDLIHRMAMKIEEKTPKRIKNQLNLVEEGEEESLKTK